MDSAKSESLQSSSGGDEEYDDTRAAVSIFMNTRTPSHLRPISTGPVPPLFHSLPIPNYIQLQNPNSTTPIPATMRSDPNPSSSHATCIFQAPTKAVSRKRSRSRSRASRRDPTTVLTTDTTNFRAMVQEFTGIPAPPFNNSSASFSRTSFDLFGRATSTGCFEPPTPSSYLRRQKLLEPPSPFVVSSSIATSPINDYQLPIIQNPNTSSSFTTCFLQSNPKFVFSSSNTIASKPHDQDQDSFGIPINIDDFGFNFDQNHAYLA